MRGAYCHPTVNPPLNERLGSRSFTVRVMDKLVPERTLFPKEK